MWAADFFIKTSISSIYRTYNLRCPLLNKILRTTCSGSVIMIFAVEGPKGDPIDTPSISS